ncbi:hypothetical protein JCM24511_02100 [Saitozyma sp. JCM 24511]|nr:hypothetical protein JCM24511_02100 [Saitozyma sp. JCM 24511]
MKAAITALSLAISTFATAFGRSFQSRGSDVSNGDFQLLNLARNLEALQLAFWNQGLQTFNAEDFDRAGYPGFRQWIELFRDQKLVQFTGIKSAPTFTSPCVLHPSALVSRGCVLNSIIRKEVCDDPLSAAAGGNFTNCTYMFPVTDPKELLRDGQVVTTVRVGASIAVAGAFTQQDLRVAAAAIVGGEARQNSKLRQELGLAFFNGDIFFDTPLTPSQEYSLSEPIFSCAASNPPIDFQLIPPLEARFTHPGPHKPGDTVTAFLVATTYTGPAPIPDEDNLAIGHLVVM